MANDQTRPPLCAAHDSNPRAPKASVPPGAYELVCLPLRIAGGDGAIWVTSHEP